MTVEVIALDGLKLSEEAFEVILPAVDGQIAVYSNTAPVVSVIHPGVLKIRRSQGDTDDKLEIFAVGEGVAEFSGKRLRILADSANISSEISAQQAKEALARAKQLAATATERDDINKALREIALQQSRLHVASIKKRRL